MDMSKFPTSPAFKCNLEKAQAPNHKGHTAEYAIKNRSAQALSGLLENTCIVCVVGMTFEEGDLEDLRKLRRGGGMLVLKTMNCDCRDLAIVPIAED